jgi:hypothetical protein
MKEEEKAVLIKIATNDISLAAFSGMIFNQMTLSNTPFNEENIDFMIMKAIKVRNRVKELAEV